MMRDVIPVSSYLFRMRLGFLFIFFVIFFYAQTFTNDNPAITVKDGSYLSISDSIGVASSQTEVQNLYDQNTEVFISEHTLVSGIEHFENADLNYIKENLYEPEKVLPVKETHQTNRSIKISGRNFTASDIQYSENTKNSILQIKESCKSVASGPSASSKIKAVLEKSSINTIRLAFKPTQKFSYFHPYPLQLHNECCYSRPPPSFC